MNVQSTLFNPKLGYFSIFGAVSMLIGAALWGSTGTDLWDALANDKMSEYLTAVAQVKTQLAANTSFWIIGVILFSIGITIMGNLCVNKSAYGIAAKTTGTAGAILGIISFVTMLSLTMVIAPGTSENAILMAKTIGWIGARLDDFATILIIGISPLLLSIGGQGEWMPRWLSLWGYIAGAVSVIAIVGFYVPSISFFTFVLLPFGMGWMIAAGIVLLKKK